MNLLRGFKTSEFLLIILGFIFALAVAKGWLSAERVQYTASKVQQTTDAIPALIDAIKDLVKSLGPMAGYLAQIGV